MRVKRVSLRIYLLVSNRVKDKLFQALIKQIERFYGSDPRKSEHYARIISDKHFDRVSRLIQGCTVVTGGRTDPAERYIAPTILDDVKLKTAVVQEESSVPSCLGSPFAAINESIEIVNSLPKPLSLYLFAEDGRVKEEVLNKSTSGGGCINDTLLHVGNVHLPFWRGGNEWNRRISREREFQDIFPQEEHSREIPLVRQFSALSALFQVWHQAMGVFLWDKKNSPSKGRSHRALLKNNPAFGFQVPTAGSASSALPFRQNFRDLLYTNRLPGHPSNKNTQEAQVDEQRRFRPAGAAPSCLPPFVLPPR